MSSFSDNTSERRIFCQLLNISLPIWPICHICLCLCLCLVNLSLLDTQYKFANLSLKQSAILHQESINGKGRRLVKLGLTDQQRCPQQGHGILWPFLLFKHQIQLRYGIEEHPSPSHPPTPTQTERHRSLKCSEEQGGPMRFGLSRSSLISRYTGTPNCRFL